VDLPPEPPPQPPSRSRHGANWVIVLVVALVVLGFWAAADPRLNVPGISPFVCSLKHDDWYPGGLLGAPGCYASSTGATGPGD
jgi:hypothetical protein